MTKVILALSLSVAVGGMAGCSTPTPEKQTASQPVMSHKSLPASSPAGRKDTRKETREGTTTRQTPPSTSPVPSETDPTIAPNDTGRNVRDREAKRLTPMDQSSDPADLEITRRIRKALLEDDSLSTTAKNIKIITVNGTVTLRGPVKTPGERVSILEKANSVANGRVDNELEVTSR